MSAILVDLGGTHLRFAVARGPGDVTLLRRKKVRNHHSGLDQREIWKEIADSITSFSVDFREAVESRAPLIISFPGPVNDACGIVDAPTVAGHSASFPDLARLLSERIGRPVRILNDISAAAWHAAEHVRADRFLVVTVSSGIGSKVFDRDHPRRVLDDAPYAGEIGHLKVDETPSAPLCDCGGSGHLGAIASGRGIERYARERAQTDPAFFDSLCARRFGAEPEAVTNEAHLVPAGRAGDPWALEVIRTCTVPLARVLLQAVLTSGLERVVIVGGFALGLGETYRSLLQQEISLRADYRVLGERLNDVVVLGKEDACLFGAAVYAEQHAQGWQ